MERQPDFEDDKIRIWGPPQAGEPRPDEDDPTVMGIDWESEEIEESRTYRLRPLRQALRRLDRLLQADKERRNEPLVAMALLGPFALDTEVKILAKRHKETNDISYHIVAISLGIRHLIRPLRTVGEEEYRAKVAGFEKEWITDGPLRQGQVVTRLEWRRYEERLRQQNQSPSWEGT